MPTPPITPHPPLPTDSHTHIMLAASSMPLLLVCVCMCVCMCMCVCVHVCMCVSIFLSNVLSNYFKFAIFLLAIVYSKCSWSWDRIIDFTLGLSLSTSLLPLLPPLPPSPHLHHSLLPPLLLFSPLLSSLPFSSLSPPPTLSVELPVQPHGAMDDLRVPRERLPVRLPH